MSAGIYFPQALAINRPVSWRSSGAGQAQLMQLVGAQGSTVDDVHYGFILAAASYPSFDQYQDVSVGQQWVGLENIMIVGGGADQSWQVGGASGACTLSGPTYCTDGLLFQAPAGGAGHQAATGVLRDLQVVNFPGHALPHFAPEASCTATTSLPAARAAIAWISRTPPIRTASTGFPVAIAPSGQSGDARSMEFHGASFWGNQTASLSVTGTLGDDRAYLLFDGLQLGSSQNEDMYLDQQNETVICAANCLFGKANASRTAGVPAILIGPDAATTAPGVSPIVLQLDQGLFDVPDVRHNGGQDIEFQSTTGATSHECSCIVALGPGMVDVDTKQNASQPGAPTTNDSTKLSGQTTYAPPTFANAGSVGVPLTLNPNELGMGVSMDTEGAPGPGGLKLRVECSTIGSHNVKIVALAGISNTETVIADGIGNHQVAACQ